MRLMNATAVIAFALSIATAINAQTVLPPVSAPGPPTGPAQPVMPERDPTTIPVTVTADLQNLLNQVNSRLPQGDDEDGAWGVIANDFAGNVALKYKLWRDDPTISVVGNEIVLAMNLYYHAAIAQRVRNGIFVGGYSWHQVASCGLNEPARQVHVQVTYHLNWQSDYHLTGSGTINTTYSNCLLTAMNFNVTPRIQSIVDPKVKDAADGLLNLISSQDFRPQVQQIWATLRNPINTPGLQGTLYIGPQWFGVTALMGSGHMLTDVFVLQAYPNVFTAPPPGVVAPPMDMFQGPIAVPNLQLMSPHTDSRFRVNVTDRLPFTRATAVAKQQLDGKTMNCLNLQCQITVQEVGGNSRMAYVKLLLGGDLQGTVYLTGDMVYDPSTYIFSIQNLRLTPGEVSAFTQTVIDSLQDPAFLKSIADKLQWPLRDKIEAFKNDMNARLQNAPLPNGFKLKGGITDLAPTYITAYPQICDPVFPPELCQQDVTMGTFLVSVQASGNIAISQ